MTLNCISSNLQRISRDFADLAGNNSQTNPYCQRRYCSPLNVLFNGVSVDVVGRSSARGRQIRVGLIKQAVFELSASISRKRKEIRSKLLLTSNRMLYMHFPLASRWMTLDGIENFTGFRRFGRQHLLSR